jgi:hypothetical protein
LPLALVSIITALCVVRPKLVRPSYGMIAQSMMQVASVTVSGNAMVIGR